MKMNFMHISSNLRLGGVSLYIGSKKESMPKRLHEVNMHAQYSQEPIPKTKKYQLGKRYQMNKTSLGGYP